jgi:hypothetical protein
LNFRNTAGKLQARMLFAGDKPDLLYSYEHLLVLSFWNVCQGQNRA